MNLFLERIQKRENDTDLQNRRNLRKLWVFKTDADSKLARNLKDLREKLVRKFCDATICMKRVVKVPKPRLIVEDYADLGSQVGLFSVDIRFKQIISLRKDGFQNSPFSKEVLFQKKSSNVNFQKTSFSSVC